MASSSGKEQFLKQFETIVAGVKRNKAMVILKKAQNHLKIKLIIYTGCPKTTFTTLVSR